MDVLLYVRNVASTRACTLRVDTETLHVLVDASVVSWYACAECEV